LNILDTSIEYIKGVGPAKAEILRNELQIYTFSHLMTYFPFRYIDKRKINTIAEIDDNTQEIQLRGYIVALETIGVGRNIRLEAKFRDKTGIITLVWFKGIRWIKDKLKPNVEYIIFGKPANFLGSYNISHPEIETISEYQQTAKLRFHPVYRSTERMKNAGLNSKGLSKIMENLFEKIYNSLNENLPAETLQKYKLISRKEALYKIHFPTSENDIQESNRRLKFEELFFLQMNIITSKIRKSTITKGFIFDKVGDLFNTFYHNNIQFELTGAQKKVVKEIRNDFKKGKQMNRLLQGDVGSGKTLVALMSMIIAVENKFQAAFMAPTEILANQHFKTISKMTEGLGLNVKLFTGNTKQKEKNLILEELKSGKIDIIIGTHILIEDYVEFYNLGFVVIDEQHRFGVAQRAKMWSKNNPPPHILVMTATPIPRTLAMTVYGDLDYSVIDELPPGRKAVKTIYLPQHERLRLIYFLKDQIAKGQQVYFVFPLIYESNKLDLRDLMDGFERLSREFPIPEYQISIVHGQQKPEHQEIEMNRFVKHETQILIATTVIEVGVDVPNASVMVVENAERFGLSQLHQLRGRVGRGAAQSYCILTTGEKVSQEGKNRIATMVSSNDGFVIAEADMRLRGPGDLHGTRQSGILDLKIADIAQDEAILQAARDEAFEILENDPQLQNIKNSPTRQYLEQQTYAKNIWSNIS
jgi:ATP-dependent DNA helicase RecG